MVNPFTLSIKNQTYVTFHIAVSGSDIPNLKTAKVSSRDIEELTIPQGGFAFTFWDRIEAEFNGELLLGEKNSESELFYIGEIFTIERLRADTSDPDYVRLAEKMETEGWKFIVHCPHVGTWRRLMGDQVVIPLDSVTFED